MKFTVSGSRIICSRADNTVDEECAYRRVVEFDAHVDTIPPHVAARLTAGEVEQLAAFMADRKRIQANPIEKNMLEALPTLLEEAAEILGSVDRVNNAMYQQLSAAIAGLSAALNSVKPAQTGNPTAVNRMRKSEAQKERLENIRRSL